MTMDVPSLALLAWANVCLIWGTTYLVIRIGVSEMPPFLFAGIRWLIAGFVFTAVLRLKGTALPARRELGHLAVVGILLLGLGNGLVVFGEQWVASGPAALMITTTPLVMVALESLLPRRPRLNLAVAGGLLLGLAGVLLIFGVDLEALSDPGNRSGLLSLLGAVFFWSLGSLYSKYVRLAVHPFMGAAAQMIIAGAVLTLVGVAAGEIPRLHWETRGLWSLAYLVIIGSFVGYPSYIYAVAKLPLSFVSTYAYINPVIALFLGWLVLEEPLGLQVAGAAALILAGVWCVKQGASRP